MRIHTAGDEAVDDSSSDSGSDAESSLRKLR